MCNLVKIVNLVCACNTIISVIVATKSGLEDSLLQVGAGSNSYIIITILGNKLCLDQQTAISVATCVVSHSTDMATVVQSLCMMISKALTAVTSCIMHLPILFE